MCVCVISTERAAQSHTFDESGTSKGLNALKDQPTFIQSSMTPSSIVQGGWNLTIFFTVRCMSGSWTVTGSEGAVKVRWRQAVKVR